MRFLILGGIAAGTKTAAKLKRELPQAEVVLLTKDSGISSAACGIPYYVGGIIEDSDALVTLTPQKFAAMTGVEVHTDTEATAVSPADKTVTAKELKIGEILHVSYDKLVIATGASPVTPTIDGLDGKEGVFSVRTPADGVRIRSYINQKQVRNAVIIGAGYIGLEMADNLRALGVNVTVVESAAQLLPDSVDAEIAAYVKRHLLKNGIHVITGAKATEVLGESAVSAVRTTVGSLSCELLIVAAGIRPNTAFLDGSGVALQNGYIVTDGHLQTNVEDIYAVGDCITAVNRLTGKACRSPMGSSANMQGRTLAQILGGKDKRYPGVLSTAIIKLPGLNAARTGLTEIQAQEAGFETVTALALTDDKPAYYPDHGFFAVKLIAEKDTHRLLGAQVLGSGAVDKMIDIAVTGINLGACLEDFENADYAYAPPFSTAIHPFVQAVYILLNKINGDLVSMTPAEYMSGKAQGFKVVDTSSKPAIRGAIYVDLTTVNGEIPGLAKDEPLLLVCNRARRAYMLQKRMRFYGYTNTDVLEGASSFNEVRVQNAACTVSPEDVTRVKAWGFLRDKRTADRFNGRVITRNGKITAEESKVIAQAAELFGSGEITMTSRLTLEIQGVPFDSIEPLREYLAQYGLETGGT
ncbi:MAG: FAD-dependent oxidoreductase, partial [Eubacteriales bacterium]